MIIDDFLNFISVDLGSDDDGYCEKDNFGYHCYED